MSCSGQVLMRYYQNSMATRKRYRRSKKTAPLQELGFVVLLAIVVFAIGFQQYAGNYDLGLLIGLLLSLLLLGGGGFYLFLARKQQIRRRAFRALQISHIDTMRGDEFEEYIAELLRFQGYQTRMTPRSGDYGVDIVASKGGVKTAVQIKRYNKKLDQKPIREAVAGMSVRQYGCTKAMVVTNSTFTRSAVFLAAESGCELIDREKLGEWILMFQGGMPAKK